MAFSAKKLNDNDINNGNPYIDGSGFTPSDFNKAVEGVLWLNEKVGSGSSGGGSTIYKHSFNAYNGEVGYNGWFYALTEDKIVESSIEDNQLLIAQTNFTSVIGYVVMEEGGEVSTVELNADGQFVFGEGYFTQEQIGEKVEGV